MCHAATCHIPRISSRAPHGSLAEFLAVLLRPSRPVSQQRPVAPSLGMVACCREPLPSSCYVCPKPCTASPSLRGLQPMCMRGCPAASPHWLSCSHMLRTPSATRAPTRTPSATHAVTCNPSATRALTCCAPHRPPVHPHAPHRPPAHSHAPHQPPVQSHAPTA
jgi:hypothetical protein